MSDILPDVLQMGLTIVFCGTAASAKSAEIGAYYGNPTNAFWRTLHAIGLTPYQLHPTAFKTLTDYGIGLTDIAKQAMGNDDVLSPSDFDSNGLAAKIKVYQPHVLAFTSKRAFRAWAGLASHQAVDYAWQVEMIGQTKIFVLPSPSGAARGYWDLSIWQTLADCYQQLREQHGNDD